MDECQRVGMPGLGSRLSTYWPKKWFELRCSQHWSADQTLIPCVSSRHLDSNKIKCMWRPCKLGLSCKANKCSYAGVGDLGVLPTHESSPCNCRWYQFNPPWVNAATSASSKYSNGCMRRIILMAYWKDRARGCLLPAAKICGHQSKFTRTYNWQ